LHIYKKALRRQGELVDIAAKLRAYRPAATVLEAEVAPARTGDGGTGASGRGGPQMFLEVMRLKRGTHDGAIQARRPARRARRRAPPWQRTWGAQARTLRCGATSAGQRVQGLRRAPPTCAARRWTCARGLARPQERSRPRAAQRRRARRQATKREARNLAASEAAGADTAGGAGGAPGGEGAGALEEQRRRATEAALMGDGPGCSGRFRDGDYFVPAARAARHPEEGFSVRGGSDRALAGAVLDLMADDEARSSTSLICQRREAGVLVTAVLSAPSRLTHAAL